MNSDHFLSFLDAFVVEGEFRDLCYAHMFEEREIWHEKEHGMLPESAIDDAFQELWEWNADKFIEDPLKCLRSYLKWLPKKANSKKD